VYCLMDPCGLISNKDDDDDDDDDDICEFLHAA